MFAEPSGKIFRHSEESAALLFFVHLWNTVDIHMRNRPWVSSKAIIPAFCTGLVYGCAMSAFVVAIDKLNAAIAYPIGQMAPGLVVSTWSVLYYREITVGKKKIGLCPVTLKRSMRSGRPTCSALIFLALLGLRNLLILTAAYLLTVAGVVIVTISKEICSTYIVRFQILDKEIRQFF
ncbi:unnamed protein product [Strongylus vulgaris]|uniref:Uncharacterized protein n=1 Tax=Strongylus vulgaris TaxID=40348 RepID=A0A3P7JF80_STRVU|nr:unnamed protein product [Strongylus vulgaris]